MDGCEGVVVGHGAFYWDFDGGSAEAVVYEDFVGEFVGFLFFLRRVVSGGGHFLLCWVSAVLMVSVSGCGNVVVGRL